MTVSRILNLSLSIFPLWKVPPMANCMLCVLYTFFKFNFVLIQLKSRTIMLICTRTSLSFNNNNYLIKLQFTKIQVLQQCIKMYILFTQLSLLNITLSFSAMSPNHLVRSSNLACRSSVFFLSSSRVNPSFATF